MKFILQFLKKKKTISLDVRCAFQLLDTMRLNDKGTLNSYKTRAKGHSKWRKNYPFHSKLNIFIFSNNMLLVNDWNLWLLYF